MDEKPDENWEARFLTRFLSGVLGWVISRGAVKLSSDYPKGCDLEVVFIWICSHTFYNYLS